MGDMQLKGIKIGKIIIANIDNIRNADYSLTMDEAEHIVKEWLKIKRYLREQNE